MLSLVAALGYGLVSAFVPLLNAEAYAVAAGRMQPIHVVAAVVALAAGQTVGKLVLFEAARRGSARFAGNRTGEDRSARIRARMTGRRSVATVVLAAATLGLPPLAAVSLAAGHAVSGGRTSPCSVWSDGPRDSRSSRCRLRGPRRDCPGRRGIRSEATDRGRRRPSAAVFGRAQPATDLAGYSR